MIILSKKKCEFEEQTLVKYLRIFLELHFKETYDKPDRAGFLFYS